MRKILIFGNSGSGKSTLSRKFKAQGLAHLDLDSVAWDITATTPIRKEIAQSAKEIRQFLSNKEEWVVEGCYSDLLELLTSSATTLIYMNLSVEQCIENAKRRDWEPHKYPSKQAQDANLNMLLQWIADYPHRSDIFSQQAHLKLYERFQSDKKMYLHNPTAN